jgi:hypothetical protein
MCTCIYCLVEYSLEQDEPWLEGTIIPNTLRKDRTSEDDVYMYLLFSGVKLGPGVGGDHYTKHHPIAGQDERGLCVHVFTVKWSTVHTSLIRTSLVEGTIKTNTHSIAPGRDERGRCVHVFTVYWSIAWTRTSRGRDRTSEEDLYIYFLFSGVQPGPGRALVGGDHYTNHIAPGRDERGRCVHVFTV